MERRDFAYDILKASAADIQQGRDGTYEEAVVTFILQKTGQAARAADVRAQGRDDKLSIENLILATNFPIWLGAKRIRDNPAMDSILDKKLEKSAVWRAFFAVTEDVPDTVAAEHWALVFPWKGHSKFMCFHNFVGHYPSGAAWRHYHVDGHQYFLEYFEDFLKSLGTPAGW